MHFQRFSKTHGLICIDLHSYLTYLSSFFGQVNDAVAARDPEELAKALNHAHEAGAMRSYACPVETYGKLQHQ